ncbi:hypothetical protein PV661_11915 [Streptomyces sp. MD20-1-1]|uniref:hypothetical protein n=1 Tax=Streptomyces sp. MD20-1-1 TaxID=3028668 RepID=UPI0029A12850|nr:hypothetical protein [Streptomyces sp. MD20-1-1]
MNTDTLRTIVDELTASGWHALDPNETDPLAPIVQALQRHRVRADDRAVRSVSAALEARRPKPDPEPLPEGVPADLGLPVPTVEELAQEAAWWVDTMFAYSLVLPRGETWDFVNDDMDLVFDHIPADVRRTCHRAGMTVAAAHGCPDQAPTMRQVANALIRRMSRDGRVQR